MLSDIDLLEFHALKKSKEELIRFITFYTNDMYSRGIFFKGQPITEMSKKELIDCFIYICKKQNYTSGYFY